MGAPCPTGVLVPFSSTGTYNRAKVFRVTADAIADAVRSVRRMPIEERKRRGVAARAQYLADRAAFHARAGAAIDALLADSARDNGRRARWLWTLHRKTDPNLLWNHRPGAASILVMNFVPPGGDVSKRIQLPYAIPPHPLSVEDLPPSSDDDT